MPEALPTVAQDVGAYYLQQSENWIYHQVRQLERFRAIFLAKRTVNRDRYPWGPVYSVQDLHPVRRLWNRFSRTLFGYYTFYAEVCRREDVRLVHAHQGPHGIRALGLARALDVPLVTSFYGRDMYLDAAGEEGLRRRYQDLFARGSAFVAEGPAAHDQLIRIGCPPEKILIHRLGVDLEAIACEPRSVARDQPLKVLMAARFVEKKGLPYGVEAFCRVAREDSRLQLTVVGDAGKAPEQRRIREHLRQLVTDYDVTDRVGFEGFLSSSALHELARGHHLFLHPSVHAADGDAEGGHPVVLTEMAASGMPIIATRHCDIPEVVTHGETGWLCAERSVEAIESALREALNRPEALAAYGLAARRLVESKYDARSQTFDGLYAAVLSDRSVFAEGVARR